MLKSYTVSVGVAAQEQHTHFSGLGIAVPTVFWGALPALESA